jgi:KDO2-lipid IV(A) lauroyltransferase
MPIGIERSSTEATPRKDRKHSAFYANLGIALWWFFSLIPVRCASAIGGFISAYFIYYLPYIQHLRTNLDLIFPEKSAAEKKRIARQMAWNIGRTSAEYPHLGDLTDPTQNWITLKGWDVYERARDAGRPVIFTSGHLANWELTAGAGARRGVPVTVVYAARPNGALERRLQQYRMAMKCGLTPRGDAARPIIKRLTRKECVGIIVDQRADDGILVPFFGRPAPTTDAPARLAIKFNAVIIPVECRRLKGPTFEVTFHDAVRPEDFRDEADPVYAMMKRLNDLLEIWIRDHPGDWLCRRRRWSKWPART